MWPVNELVEKKAVKEKIGRDPHEFHGTMHPAEKVFFLSYPPLAAMAV